MKRTFLILLFLLVPLCAMAQDCPDNLDDCPREGCSPDNHHDPRLNRLKNLKSSGKPVQDRSLADMKMLETKIRKTKYKKSDARTIPANLGEGDQIRVVGYLLAIKKEGAESCNCGLSETDVTTDNHLVLVEPSVVKKFPLPPNATKKTLTGIFHKREKFSVTAEFTPRVRAEGHPNFNRKLQFEMLNKDKTPAGAIWVRVTGQLMFDSEHYKSSVPRRATSWEIHPILKFEVCSKGKTCPKAADDDWVDLDSMP